MTKKLRFGLKYFIKSTCSTGKLLLNLFSYQDNIFSPFAPPHNIFFLNFLLLPILVTFHYYLFQLPRNSFHKFSIAKAVL